MSIHESDLFHGAFIAKLLKEAPEAIRLIEHHSSERAIYEVDGLPGAAGMVYFHVKYSVTPRVANGGCSWFYTFLPEHLREIRRYGETSDVRVVLVCGRSDLKEKAVPMEICLISLAELDEAVGTSSEAAVWVRIDVKPGERLRLSGPRRRRDPLVIARNRVDILLSA